MIKFCSQCGVKVEYKFSPLNFALVADLLWESLRLMNQSL